MRFALKQLTGRVAGRDMNVATAAVRSCVSLLSSEERSERIYLVSGLAKRQLTQLLDTRSKQQ